MTPFLIGVAGGSGSGKTTFCRMLTGAAPPGAVAVIEHDFYYRCLAHTSVEYRDRHNFDHPDSLETDLLVAHLEALKLGSAIEAPQYDYTTSSRPPATKRIEPHPALLVDGILIYCDERLRTLFDLKVFVDAPADLRYQRRLERDGLERKRTPQQVLEQYLATVKPMHEQFVAPCRELADVVVHGGAHFGPAVQVFAALVREKTEQQRDA